jgi:DNA-binding NarL/FixJ family response regulator
MATVRNMMPKHVTLALIVASPGPLRNSLQALMTTMPQIEVLAETSDPSALLRMGAEMEPDVVLLDASLPEEGVWPALQHIGEQWCQCRSIVLVEDSQQQQEARAAGADVALLKGYPAAKLIAAIEGLLPQEEEGGACAHSKDQSSADWRDNSEDETAA